MKAITLTQPWATLVAIGAKRVETRSWPTAFRGAVAIHAAKGMPRYAQEALNEEPFWTVLHRVWGADTNDFVLPRRAVVARATLVDVWRVERPNDACRWGLSQQEQAFGDYSVGRYAWFFSDIVPLSEPILAKGALGLWEWAAPPTVEAIA